jgi:LmbE family N-acetylglucosaminyl deacetylase
MSNYSGRRRSFLKNAAAMGILFPLGRMENKNAGKKQENKLSVVCVGGHPDDPESGCGGTLINYALQGHGVGIVYLTRGEAGIEGKSHEEASRIRSAEAEAASKIIGATPYFLGQTDGSTFFNRPAIESLHQLLQKLKPDILLTHWPIDSHPDHQVASLLSYQCWLRMKRSFALYYFEVNSGSQTMHFTPTDYTDISAVADQKKKTLYAHTSQNPDEIYLGHHWPMQQFRGREIGVKEAEAFVRLRAGRQTVLPPGSW